MLSLLLPWPVGVAQPLTVSWYNMSLPFPTALPACWKVAVLLLLVTCGRGKKKFKSPPNSNG